MTPKKNTHIEFCKSVAKGETQSKSYLTTIGSKNTTDAVCRSQGSKLSDLYSDYIQSLRERDADAILQASDKYTIKTALKQLLSVNEVDAILCKLVKGEDVRAIDLYYKRFGHLAVLKNENIVTVKTSKVKSKQDAKEYLKELENAV